MAHGTMDYFGTNAQSFMHRVADLAELAVRLGSSDVFDRRGNVLLMDSFDSGMAGWTEAHTSGTGWVAPIIQPTHLGRLAIGCEYSSVVGATGEIARYVAMPQISNYGFEAAFQPAANNRYFEQLFDVYDGTRVYYYGFRWYQQTGELKVLNSLYAWETITTISPLVFSGYPWFVVKLVVDMDTHHYVRAMVNATTYDISAYAPYSATADMSAIIYLSLRTANDVADTTMAAFDDIIVTMNE